MTHSASGSSSKVREFAVQRYVIPSSRRKKAEFSIPVRALLTLLKAEGFPAGNTPQVCSAIQSKKFLAENNLTIDRVDGPPSGQSTTVVVHYRFVEKKRTAKGTETAEERAIRIVKQSAGLLQPVVHQHGSAESLLLWIRSEAAF